jgi:GAF domain-containing protein
MNSGPFATPTPRQETARAGLPIRTRIGPQTRRYALAGIVFGFLFPAIGTLIILAQLHLPVNIPNIVAAQRADRLLWIIDTAPFFLGLFAALAGREQDTLLDTNRRLVDQGKELEALQTNLETNVMGRTAELESRTRQLRASAYIAQQISQFHEVPTLLSKAAQLIADQFGCYHVGILLLDDQHRIAFLQAASSGPGQALLDRGFRVELGDDSLISRVAERGKFYLQDVVDSPSGPTGDPEFPLTRSRLAVPLATHGNVIGVLDLQSRESQAFGQSEAEIVQLIADQVAAAIDSIRLVNESQVLVNQLQILTSQQTRVTWQERLKGQRLAYQFTPSGIKLMAPSSRRQADATDLNIPLLLRGQEIGSIGLKRKDNAGWTRTEHELVEKVAIQVALALDNSRLLEETRQRALQEQTVNEISARLSRSLDIDTLLQAAARELGALPEVAEVSVFIGQANGKK